MPMLTKVISNLSKQWHNYLYHYIGTLLTCLHVPELAWNWPNVDSIGPIPGEFWHIMACLQGISTEGSNIQDW